MKIQTSIEPGNVHLGLSASDLEGALTTLAELVSRDLSAPAEKVAQELLARERLGSTSVGDGFAIPHCKLPGLVTIRVALARFDGPVDFAAPDGTGVRFVFVVLSPPDQPAAHLQVLSQIARILKRKELRKELLEAPDSSRVLASIRHFAEAEGL